MESKPGAIAQAPDGTEQREESETLNSYWEILRGPIPESPEARLGRLHPGDLVVGTSKDRILVRIHPDGQITYGEGYTPDEVAEILWTTIALKRVAMEERLVHLSIIEQLVIRTGEADLHYEEMQTLARREEATEHDRFMEEIARRNLEARVHQMIDFARGVALARRRGSPTI
jgi:hypothetical protein